MIPCFHFMTSLVFWFVFYTNFKKFMTQFPCSAVVKKSCQLYVLECVRVLMRFSPRKVVRYATFLLVFMLLNVLVSYSVNIWSFNDRGKVGEVWVSKRDGDNGGRVPSHSPEGDDNSAKHAAGNRHVDEEFLRVQRSAKSLPSVEEGVLKSRNDGEGFNQFHRQVQSNLLLPDNLDKRVNEDKQPISRGSNGNKPRSSQNKETELDDLFISVKTTLKYHSSRIDLLLKTWLVLAKDQTYFFSDGDDSHLSKALGDHFINTNCSTDHSRRALSCKMAIEFDYFLASRKRWFCHVDDDVYINVNRLLGLLKKYNHRENWYLGKPSLQHPLEVVDRENPGMKLTFWFATGGAGFCLSRSLALKMAPYASGGRFMTTAERIRLPDDCTIGYIIEHLLKQKLTVIEEFNSHLEALWLIKPHRLKKQITLSYSDYGGKQNIVNVRGFSDKIDPTRMMSLHCFLYPSFPECKDI